MLYFLLSSAFAACDPAAAARLVASLPDETSSRQSAAMTGFAQVCTEPAPLLDATTRWSAAPRTDHLSLEIVVLQGAPTTWTAACPAGVLVFERVAADPSKARQATWEGCSLATVPWFTEAEWQAADGPVAIPLVAGQVLLEGGVEPESARKLVRAMARIADSSPAPVPAADPRALDAVSVAVPYEPVAAAGPGYATTGAAGPVWTAADRARGGTCRVIAHVDPNGQLAGIEYPSCDRRLRHTVTAALQASVFRAAGGDLELEFIVPR
jgi:hypothetical protein